MASPGKSVLVRDAIIFMMKLWLDGLKDIVLTGAAGIALLVDLVFKRPGQPFLFYKVVQAGERFDLWLNLYSAADTGSSSEEGLFGASRSGDNTFLGKLEELTGGERAGRKRGK
jgi:hypothetical protein